MLTKHTFTKSNKQRGGWVQKDSLNVLESRDKIFKHNERTDKLS